MLLPIDADTFTVNTTELWIVSLGTGVSLFALIFALLGAAKRDKNPPRPVSFVMQAVLYLALAVSLSGPIFETQGRRALNVVERCLRYPDSMQVDRCDKAVPVARAAILYSTADETDYPRLARTASAALGSLFTVRSMIASLFGH
jgi:hypothetical protein